MFEWIMDFWAQIVIAWESGFLGQPVGRGLLALAALALAYLVRRLFGVVVIGFLRHLAKRTRTRFDDDIVEALAQPIKLVPIAAGVFIAGRIMGLEAGPQSALALATQSILIVAVFWAFYRLADPIVGLLARFRLVFNPTVIEWLVRALRVVFVVVGVAAILEKWGIPVLPFIASLSLLSVAIALGAQDLFKNLIAGLLIMGERRFVIGDWILVDGIVEGTVEHIGFRSTMVRRFDKSLVHVPNSDFADKAVTNYSRMTHRRVSWTIGLEYGTTSEQLRQIAEEIEAYILSSDDFAKPPEVSSFVRIDGFSDSAIDLRLYAFTRTTEWLPHLTAKQKLVVEIKRIVEAAGAEFAFPSTSVYLRGPPEGGEARDFATGMPQEKSQA